MASTHKSSSHNKKRKRRQEKLQQYGIDLPEIPGVPVEIIPVLVHALKVTTKFFQHETTQAFFSHHPFGQVLKIISNRKWGNALRVLDAGI